MNDAEKTVSDKLQTLGWKIITRGWPDFLCVRRNAKNPSRVQVMCVEVKAGGDWLSEQQAIVHTFLRKAGIPCTVIKVEEVGQFSAERVKSTTVRFNTLADKPELIIETEDFDKRGVPLQNKVAELERKLSKAEERIRQYEVLILKGKSQDDDCVKTS